MTAELDFYFEQELSFLRKAIIRYADKHPEVAAKLQIDQDGGSYTDIERIVHGAAMLNARTACKLDDGQAEFIESLFSVMFPNFLKPVPSMAITQFTPGPSLASQPCVTLEREKHQLLTESESGQWCAFVLAHDVNVLPVVLEDISLGGPPYAVLPQRVPPSDRVSTLRFRIQRTAGELPVKEVLSGKFLRLFIREDRPDSFELYEFLLRDIAGITFSVPSSRTPFAELPSTGMRPVGFEDSERLLNSDARTFQGFGLLSEFFAFPGRFSFLDLEIPDLSPCGDSPSVDVHIFLKTQSEDLESKVGAGWLNVNCAPCVNVFRPGDGVVSARFDPSTHEVPVVAMAATGEALTTKGFVPHLNSRYEIYSVDHVELYNRKTQKTTPVVPLFSVPQLRHSNVPQLFYSIRREYVAAPDRRDISGSDVFLEATHPNPLSLKEAGELNYRISVRVMNRQVPMSGRLKLLIDEPVAGMEASFIRNPTAAIRPSRPSRELWRLVNHVALNQTTFLNVDALRELLSVYTIYETTPGKNASLVVDSILSVEWQRRLRRVSVDGRFAFVYGLEVTLQFKRSVLAPGKGYLLAAILARLLVISCSIGSFIEVIVEDEHKREIGRWGQSGITSEL